MSWEGSLSHESQQSPVAPAARRMSADPTGTFLLAAGQNSSTVSVFRIDRATGRLAFTGTKIDVPSPVSVVFGRTPGR